MATSKQTADYIVEQVEWAGEAYAKRMFGEYCLYFDDKVAAFICDEQLFLKITVGGGGVIKEKIEGQAYPGSKPYWVVSPDDWEDRQYMGQLLQVTADSLPLAKKKLKVSKLKQANG